MSIVNNGLLLAAEAAAAPVTGISRSLRFNSADSAYLSRTPGTAGNRKTWTWAGWVKNAFTPSAYPRIFSAGSTTSNTIEIALMASANGSELRVLGDTGSVRKLNWTTVNKFRDPGAWFHLVVALDTTQATAANRLKVYVNGTQITTAGASSTLPSQNDEFEVNNNSIHYIGRSGPYTEYMNGLLADIHFIDGQALDPSSFGEFDTNNVWQPIEYSGSYGTNGFRLPFSDNSGTSSTTLGKDAAGSNNWTPNNFSVAAGSGNDSLVDVPTASGTDTGAGGEVRGNYATLNPLIYGGSISAPTNGNLDVSSSTAYGTIYATIGVNSGKWYWEFTNTSTGSGGSCVGISAAGATLSSDAGAYSKGYIYCSSALKANNNSYVSYGASWNTNGDIIGIAFDADNGTLTFYKNGSTQGQAYSGIASTSEFYFPVFADSNGVNSGGGSFNFGQRPFAYTAPSGFKALCTTNLPTPTIEDGSTVMDVKLYTGNGGSQTISGYSFSPDLVWIKQWSGGTDHGLFDTVRGVYLQLRSNTTAGDNTVTNALTSFTSDGYVLGGDGPINANGLTYVNWAWDAGSSTVTNTQGSISSQVRANASAGFSIVTYTGDGSGTADTPSGDTVGHGLGVAPKLIIGKRRDAANGWPVYHGSLANTQLIELNSTGAASTSAMWGNSTPTSTTIALGNNPQINATGSTYVLYCFAPVAGYSSFGSYTGNGATGWPNADGPFVYLGFRPKFILWKCTSQVENWVIYDSLRETYNFVNDKLLPNSSAAESTNNNHEIDFLSNGFKVRNNTGEFNQNAGTYIYAAFAEHPFAYARAR